MWQQLKRILTGRTRAQHDGNESDVSFDPAQATGRATGGVAEPDAQDAGSTTGASTSEGFVGRVAGQDVGYAGETGAEARAEAAQEHTTG
jgi:hypothetical protein